MQEGCRASPRGDGDLVTGTGEKWLVTHDLSRMLLSPQVSEAPLGGCGG